MSTARLRFPKGRIDLLVTLSAFLLCFAIVANIGLSAPGRETIDRPGQGARYAAVRP